MESLKEFLKKRGVKPEQGIPQKLLKEHFDLWHKEQQIKKQDNNSKKPAVKIGW